MKLDDIPAWRMVEISPNRDLRRAELEGEPGSCTQSVDVTTSMDPCVRNHDGRSNLKTKFWLGIFIGV